MSPSKSDSDYYTPLPQNSGAAPILPNYIILYRNILPIRPTFLRRCLSFSVSLLLLSLLAFILFPSDPEISVVRVHLNGVSIRTTPTLSVDLSLSLLARVRNRDVFSLDYDSLAVSIGYRGRQLGVVDAEGGHLKARASSYVNATLVMDGLQVFHDFFYFLEDVARGSVPFDTESSVQGRLGVFSVFSIPLKAKVSCEVNVDPQKQTIIRQNCYPE